MRRLSLLLTALTLTTMLAGSALAAEPPAVKQFVTRQSGTFNGKKIDYVATAGETILANDAGQPAASFFSFSYVQAPAKEMKEPNPRPVLFIFNGGPGSASVYLHMGAFGPKRAVLPEDVNVVPVPPYRTAPNTESVLDVADLVFIDPIRTGFSRLLPDGKAEDFYSTDGDAKSFADFIVAWSAKNGRLNSPKYIIGESYGTVRAAVVAEKLVTGRSPTAVGGVVLVGQAIMLTDTVQRPGNIVSPMVSLPSIAATAFYHGKIDKAGRTQEAFLDEVRKFARGEYVAALAQGRDLPDADRKKIAERLAGYTGIETGYFLANNLSISKPAFAKALLKREGKVLGEYDSRYVADAPASATDVGAGDPSASSVALAYGATWADYLERDLGVKMDQPYQLSDPQAYPKWKWAAQAGSPFVDYSNVPALSRTMKTNPQFRILFANGIYDLATTFGAAEYTVAHSDLPRDRVQMKYYPSGHMSYTNEASLRAFNEDVRAFVTAPAK